MLNRNNLINNYYKHYEFIKKAGNNEELQQSSEESPYFDAVEQVWEIIGNNSEEGWKLILRLIGNAPDDEILANIGTGVLEDFLVKYGDEYIDRVGNEASKNKQFHTALSNVWQNDMNDYIWAKVCQVVELGINSK